MNKKLRNIERRAVGIYEFWMNFFYYLEKGHRPRTAWEMAGVTLP
jgi:hypothetical protein